MRWGLEFYIARIPHTNWTRKQRLGREPGPAVNLKPPLPPVLSPFPDKDLFLARLHISVDPQQPAAFQAFKLHVPEGGWFTFKP